MVDLDHGPGARKRVKGCGSGHEYLAVTPEGDLFPCHQFVGMKQFRMGNVSESFDIDTSISDMFRKQNIYTNPECRKCWAKFFCSGGCAAKRLAVQQQAGQALYIGCELERKEWNALVDQVVESGGIIRSKSGKYCVERGVALITVEDVRKNREVRTFWRSPRNRCGSWGYTGNFRHVAWTECRQDTGETDTRQGK